MSVLNGKPVTRDNLNDVMEFDHVIQIHADGTVSEPDGIWAPEVTINAETDPGSIHKPHVSAMRGQVWHLLNGYSGQDSYAGPIMHASEYIGGGMADDLLSKPGIYVVVTVTDDDTDRDADDDVAGWAIAQLVEIPADFPVKVLTAEEIAATCGVCRPGHKIPGEPMCYRHGKVIREVMTCGECGRSWDDSIGTEWTPAPAARCPFEYFH